MRRAVSCILFWSGISASLMSQPQRSSFLRSELFAVAQSTERVLGLALLRVRRYGGNTFRFQSPTDAQFEIVFAGTNRASYIGHGTPAS